MVLGSQFKRLASVLLLIKNSPVTFSIETISPKRMIDFGYFNNFLSLAAATGIFRKAFDPVNSIILPKITFLLLEQQLLLSCHRKDLFEIAELY